MGTIGKQERCSSYKFPEYGDVQVIFAVEVELDPSHQVSLQHGTIRQSIADSLFTVDGKYSNIL